MTDILTYENLIKARDYIFSNADEINKAWYRYNFEGEDTGAFMEALAKYQHENGGIGGLVYEYDYKGPTLHSVEHAFRYICYLKEKPSADHPVIRKMMGYLLERYRPEIGCWGDLLVPEVNDGVHVWWWTYGENDFSPIADEDERIKRYDPNGQAALAGFAALYSELVPEDLYRDIIRYPVENILRYYDEASPLFEPTGTDRQKKRGIYSPYNLKCFQQFVMCLKDEETADRLASILCQHPTACMQLDFKKWEQGYEELPCNIVATPDSIVYPVVKALVDRSLDYLIRQQSVDGAWHLTFRFGEDEGFRKLEAECEAHVTMLMLAELKRFGKIES